MLARQARSCAAPIERSIDATSSLSRGGDAVGVELIRDRCDGQSDMTPLHGWADAVCLGQVRI